MKDAKHNGGVVGVRKLTAGCDGETTAVGDLVVQPAFRVAGRLTVLPDRGVFELLMLRPVRRQLRDDHIEGRFGVLECKRHSDDDRLKLS